MGAAPCRYAGVPSGTPECVTGQDGKRYRARVEIDPGVAWRQLVADTTETNPEHIYATAEELRHSWTARLGLALETMTPEEADELWRKLHLPRLSAQWAMKHPGGMATNGDQFGVGMPPPPGFEHLARELSWSTMFALGDFLNWATRHKFIIAEGEQLYATWRDKVQRCRQECDWCDSLPDDYSAKDRAAVGLAELWAMTGWPSSHLIEA